jgi:hypothetical protein
MREIPQCWITGQAAGAGAALAVQRAVAPRAVDVAELQAALAKQGVYLRPAAQAGISGSEPDFRRMAAGDS